MSRATRRAASLLVLLVSIAGLLRGDGGTLQFRKQAGPYVITAFSAPVPLRVGMADLSVLVQMAQDNSVVLDAEVGMDLSKAGEESIHVKATTSQATNKALYAAQVNVPASGQWRLKVDVARAGKTASVSGDITVLPEEPPFVTYWVYFTVVPLGIFLFAVNQWLKSARKSSRLRL